LLWAQPQPLQRRRRLPTAAAAPIMTSAKAARLHAFTGTGAGAIALTEVVTGDALFAVFGSLVLLPAVTVGVTAPSLGAV